MTDRQSILSARLRALRGAPPLIPVAAPPPAPAPAPSSPEYLRVREVAAELRVHPRTVLKWARHGLPICRIGRITVIRRGDLDGFLVRHSQGQCPTDEDIHRHE